MKPFLQDMLQYILPTYISKKKVPLWNIKAQISDIWKFNVKGDIFENKIHPGSVKRLTLMSNNKFACKDKQT